MEINILNLFDYNALIDSYNLKIVLLLTVGFALASLLGYFAWRVNLSTIIGYLLAGYLIGPFSPGFVADLGVSEQLAEIGVILMMFGVGLNFKLKDLIKVRNIAVIGAVVQTLISSLCTALILYFFGWSLIMGIILGLSIGVASTVVLVRMLADHRILSTYQGHIAIGWLIVEDIITVIILILLPNLAPILKGSEFSLSQLLISIGIMLAKFTVLAAILLILGRKIVTYTLSKIVHTHSHELFTIAVLALIFIIATGTTLLFGISMALGAFIAGMVVGQTEVREQALVHSLAMKDAFIAIFFLSVGMLFNPGAILNNLPLFLSILGVILIIKPLVAFIISITLEHTLSTALIIAIGLAQIGEFSFILSEEAMKLNLMSSEGYDIIVAAAWISIALNPLVFHFLPRKPNKIT